MEQAKKSALIIEDEASMLSVLTDKLKELGFDTHQARNGEEGLSVALQVHPDIILLDVLMPKMDGITMMNKLREDEWGKNAPVIILTNVNPDSDKIIKSIVESQPAYYLVKSDVKLEEIVEKVQEVLSSKETPDSGATQ